MATQVPSFDELLKEALKAFKDTFGKKPEIAACAPGKHSNLSFERTNFNLKHHENLFLPFPVRDRTCKFDRRAY